MEEDKIFTEPYESWARPNPSWAKHFLRKRIKSSLVKFFVILALGPPVIGAVSMAFNLGYPELNASAMHIILPLLFGVILLMVLLSVVLFCKRMRWLGKETAQFLCGACVAGFFIVTYLVVSFPGIWLANSALDTRPRYVIEGMVTKLNQKERRGKRVSRNWIYLECIDRSAHLEIHDEADRFFSNLRPGELVWVEVGKGLFGLEYVRDIRAKS